jgi:uncharacterized protein (DUF2384 family)
MNDLLTNNDPPPVPPDLGDEAVRRCLGPAALKFFDRAMDIWHVAGEESRQLLALAPGTNLEDLDPARLSEEQILRISYLVGIFKALHILFSDALADQWVRRPNTNAMFGGRAPLAYMIGGGIEALRNVRQLLDARCAGN